MLPSQRLHAVRRLQSDIATRERKHMARNEQRRELRRLVTKQIQWETSMPRATDIAALSVFLLFAIGLIIIIP